MLNSVVVGKYNISARAVLKKSDHRRMSAIEDANDSPFHSLAVSSRRYPSDLELDMISVHSVADCIARYKDVALDLAA